MTYGVVVKYEGSSVGTTSYMVNGESIVNCVSIVTDHLETQGLIPVSLAIHEFGQSIPYNNTSTYWPELSRYKKEM